MIHSDRTSPWSETVRGFLNIFDAAAASNRDAVWNAAGAAACAGVIREMARQLDQVAPAALAEQRAAIEDLLARNQSLVSIGTTAASHIRRMQAERDALRAMVVALGGDPSDLPNIPDAEIKVPASRPEDPPA